MRPLIINSTDSTPEIRLYDNGKFHIKGRIMPENPAPLFEPMIHWLKKFNGTDIEFNMSFEYLNSGGVKELYDILQVLNSRFTLKSRIVNWYYEDGDDDNYEMGKLFEKEFRNFCFKYFIEQEAL